MSNLNPFNEFKKWLTCRIDYELDESVISSISYLAALVMFSRFNDLTVFLNDNFNNYRLVKLDKLEFFKFLKTICDKNKISYNDLVYIKFTKDKEKINTDLKKKFPFIKTDEFKFIEKELMSLDETKDLLSNKNYKLLKVKPEKLIKKGRKKND